MVDLVKQTEKIAAEIHEAIEQVLQKANYINGEEVAAFTHELEAYMGAGMHVVPCANGTDALQIALMALDLKPTDEVVVPAFTYAASAEVIALLGLRPVLVDVEPHTFNLDPQQLEAAYSPRVKAIIPVHLFGLSADMQNILEWAQRHDVRIVEDNAQSLGSWYEFDGKQVRVGTLGDISTTSFFPTKNLGCFGDGGALMTRDARLAARIRMIANHGQRQKYHHECIGCNSRLDTLQAAILSVKLKYLDEYLDARNRAANYYTVHLSDLDAIQLPTTIAGRTYHQYTLRVLAGRRDALQEYLNKHGVATMIYYPLSLAEQPAFRSQSRFVGDLTVSRQLSSEVLSLPMHTELTTEMLEYVVDVVRKFFRR